MTDTGTDRFSRRFGHGPEEREIVVRNDAPEGLRGALLMIAEGELDLSPGTIRSVLCTVLRQLPDPGNWSQYPNIWTECQQLMESAPWYRVYDFVELMYSTLAKSDEPDRALLWQSAVNEYFVEAGIGWKLVDGLLQTRGPESFETGVKTARAALAAAGLPTARNEIDEALRDLSRRPDPDLTGAIQHAMGALECAARAVAEDTKATLGEVIAKHPDLFAKALGKGLGNLWGYASEVARHVKEGGTPNRPEAELVVGVCAAACTYLAHKQD
jgi:hypothetical protein